MSGCGSKCRPIVFPSTIIHNITINACTVEMNPFLSSFSTRVSEPTSKPEQGEQKEGPVGVPLLGPRPHDPVLAHLPSPHRLAQLLDQWLLWTPVGR